MRAGLVARRVKLILWTAEDPASERIARALAREGRFTKEGGGAVRLSSQSKAALFEVEGSLLKADQVDRAAARSSGRSFDHALFLSRHSASSGIRSLTVHPLGNLGPQAKFGGAPRTIAPADPALMTALLQALWQEAKPIGFQASFEATHHGPVMDIPSLFVEVGSSPAEWSDEQACEAVARAVAAAYLQADAGVAGGGAIGIGGGHYHPRQADYARRTGTAVGHLVPRHALADLPPELLERAARMSDAQRYLVDGRRDGDQLVARAAALLADLGLEGVELGSSE